MLRGTLLASVGAMALTGSAALAADLRPPPVYVPPPPLFTWTGLYLGAQLGYVWGSDPIRVDSLVPSAFFNTQPNGVIGGFHAGYNLQLGQWVAGVEGTVDGSSLNGTRFSDSGMTIGTRTDVRGSIRARVGVALDRVLI
ncbi:MAG: outer membrane protein, partial [Gammaproteobacteria bacterium]